MKFVLVLAVFVCCAYAAPLKSELLQRAEALEKVLKNAIQKLHELKKEHVALLLEEEEKRLEHVATDLKNLDDNHEVEKAVLEGELITLEYRVVNEINRLTRDGESAELLVSNAKVLKEWVAEEIKTLEASTGTHQRRDHETARVLRRQEHELERIVAALAKVNDVRTLERLEVEIQAIEVRLYETLKHNHFVFPTGEPATGSPKPATGSPATQATQRPTTGRPATQAASSARPATARPTGTTKA